LRCIQPEVLKGGMHLINCAMDCSSLLNRLKMPPSINETYKCNSPHCPKGEVRRDLNIISVTVNADGMKNLEAMLKETAVPDFSPCQLPMTDVADIPAEHYIMDATLSTAPLCSGFKHMEWTTGPHVIVEVVSGCQRRHSNLGDHGVAEPVTCALSDVPQHIQIKDCSFRCPGSCGHGQLRTHN